MDDSNATSILPPIVDSSKLSSGTMTKLNTSTLPVSGISRVAMLHSLKTQKVDGTGHTVEEISLSYSGSPFRSTVAIASTIPSNTLRGLWFASYILSDITV